MANNKKERSTLSKWTRRAFIGFGSIAGVGLVAGIGGLQFAKSRARKFSGMGLGEGKSLNAWIKIAPDNKITLTVARSEMGQGIYTALAQLIAEELEVDMDQIEVAFPQPEPAYTNTVLVTNEAPNIFKGYTTKEAIFANMPVVATGGSTSIVDGWNNLRYAGATARQALIETAAKRWDVEAKDCYAEKAYIRNRKNSNNFTYGELAEEAGEVNMDELPKLKSRKDYKVIGKTINRVDVPEKVTGEAIFGLDVRQEGMLYGVVRHPQSIGGKIEKITNLADIEAMDGVQKVFITDYGPAIVIANNTWRASVAARSIETEEDNANVDISTKSLQAKIDELIKAEPIEVRINEGDALAVLDDDSEGKVIEARYDLPYLAHATMEPMNCTVLIKNGKCVCWVGHQAPSMVHNILKETTGIAKKDITINTVYLGGGFGRRAEPDYVRFAGAAAKAMEGIPVQTVFTREEDMQNDTYRPMASCVLKAKVKANGEIEAFDSMSVSQSCQNNSMMRILPAMASAPKDDLTTVEGIENLPYIMNNKRVAFGNLELPIQIGFWRSVGYSQNSFFAESFMDECAHAVNIDPYEFRRTKLKEKPRFVAVLDKVADMSGWKNPLPENKFRGMALVKSYRSIVAEVAEITKLGNKEFKIDKFYCAIDCGNTVNPGIIESQVSGGAIFGLTAALYGEITWDNGQVKQRNFPQYEMVRMNVCPKFEVAIMDVDEYPGGVGEPGTPPAAPALANALFAATGERVRSLPLSKLGYTFV